MWRYVTTRNNQRVPSEALTRRQMTAGRLQCQYCREWFSPQGLPGHIRTHQANHDRPSVQPRRSGIVKRRVKNADGSYTTLSKEESERLSLHEQRERERERGRVSEQDNIIVIDDDEGTDGTAVAAAPASASASAAAAAGRGTSEGAPAINSRAAAAAATVAGEKTPEDDENAVAGEKTPEDDGDIEEEEDDVADAAEGGKTPESDEDGGEDGDGTELEDTEDSFTNRSRNWRLQEKAEILKEFDELYNEGTFGKLKFCRHIQEKYNRKFVLLQLNRLLDKRQSIMENASKTNSDRRSQSTQQRTGKYPEMEARLAARIRGMRRFGFVVESWMVDYEAKLILHELYEHEFPKPSEDGTGDEDYPFKCSDTWRKDFFKRHNFSLKKIGKKSSPKAGVESMPIIADYHLRTRVLQLSCIRDPVFGFTSPYYVYSHDQVPLELSDSNGTTVHDTGDKSVFDGFGKDEDSKRFCTLNLFGAMKYDAGVLNVPKPHIVFSGVFKPGTDWHDKDEVAKWDKDVFVSFQENGWVDARTHELGLKGVLGPINKTLIKEDMYGVTFEDNLTSHKTEAIMRFWDTDPSVSNFIRPQFVPPKLTDIIQVIDRHIGIIYKSAVYRAVRAEYMRRYREAVEAAKQAGGNVDEVTVDTFTPKEKRIIVTKAIGDCHRKLTHPSCLTYFRAFIATGTWMPISHFIEDPVLRSFIVPEEDSQVSLQHLPDYDYQEECSREKVLAAVKAAKDEKEKARIEKEAAAKAIADGLAMHIASTEVYVEKAAAAMALIAAKVNELTSETLQLIHQETGHERFIIGGSWASFMITKALEALGDDVNYCPCHLKANDIDVYYGAFADNNQESCELVVDLNCIDYKKIDSISLEVNTIKCSNLSPETMLANNDINITASCFDVDFSSRNDELVTIHASPCYWKFLFQENTEREICVSKPYDTSDYEVTTLVRMAFKAFELGFPLIFGDLDPTVGTLAESQKAKFDKMKDWGESPFHEYESRKVSSHYKLVKKHAKVNCSRCKSAPGNKSCTSKMCRKCCIAHGARVCSAHKKK